MNKKGSFELSSQTVLWVAKTLLFMLAVFIILAPIQCYITRSVEDGRAESYIFMKKVVECLEKNSFEENKLNDCMKQSKYGARISIEDKEIIFNKERYLERVFCDVYGNYFCRNETKKIENREFLIEVVVKSE